MVFMVTRRFVTRALFREVTVDSAYRLLELLHRERDHRCASSPTLVNPRATALGLVQRRLAVGLALPVRAVEAARAKQPVHPGTVAPRPEPQQEAQRLVGLGLGGVDSEAAPVAGPQRRELCAAAVPGTSRPVEQLLVVPVEGRGRASLVGGAGRIYGHA